MKLEYTTQALNRNPDLTLRFADLIHEWKGFLIGQVNIDASNLTIRIAEIDKTDSKTLGVASSLWDGSYVITVYVNHPCMTTWTMVDTLGHELKHIEQMQQRRLVTNKHTEEVYFSGKTYNKPKTHKQYYNAPWEVEARAAGYATARNWASEQSGWFYRFLAFFLRKV